VATNWYYVPGNFIKQAFFGPFATANRDLCEWNFVDNGRNGRKSHNEYDACITVLGSVQFTCFLKFSVTDRINEVDSNLNYLMGRLSLVTQQFNQIRTGLGDVLDNIRSGFKEVEKEMKG
jgi:hypothetical protein